MFVVSFVALPHVPARLHICKYGSYPPQQKVYNTLTLSMCWGGCSAAPAEAGSLIGVLASEHELAKGLGFRV